MPIPVSVVIGTTHPWPELEMTLDSLWEPLQRLGGELIIAHRDDSAIPEGFHLRFPGTICIQKPHASIFLLRSLALRKAQGEIVVITEDHCRLAPDWCARAIASHARHPDAAVIGGAVQNGSTTALIDWANFFIAHGPTMGPLETRETDAVSFAGLAVKRSALPLHLFAGDGTEMLAIRAMRQAGGKLFADGELSLDHVQSYGFGHTFVIHFHNGRSIAGARRMGIGFWSILLRIASCAILPWFLVFRTVLTVVPKRRFVRELALCFPLMILLACCHAAGELVGYCLGRGKSPTELS